MPSAAAVRSRRFRQRRGRGFAILQVEVDHFAFVEAAIEGGLISENDSEDRATLAAVAARVLTEWAKKSVTRRANEPLSRGMLPTQPQKVPCRA
jgi:hypothetical protein